MEVDVCVISHDVFLLSMLFFFLKKKFESIFLMLGFLVSTDFNIQEGALP